MADKSPNIKSWFKNRSKTLKVFIVVVAVLIVAYGAALWFVLDRNSKAKIPQSVLPRQTYATSVSVKAASDASAPAEQSNAQAEGSSQTNSNTDTPGSQSSLDPTSLKNTGSKSNSGNSGKSATPTLKQVEAKLKALLSQGNQH